MKSMKLNLLALSTIAICFHPTLGQAETGGHGSHGGDAVVCFNQPIDQEGSKLPESTLPLKIVSVRLFDYWEWSQKTGFELDLGPSSLSITEKVLKVARRLQVVDPRIAKHLKDVAKTGFTEIGFTSDATITEINDSFTDIGMKKNCYLKQIARQKRDLRFGEKKILIDGSLFARLSADEKAGLYLHEYFYEIALQYGARDSDRARYYNFMLSSRSGATNDLENYAKVLDSLYGDATSAHTWLMNRANELRAFGISDSEFVDFYTQSDQYGIRFAKPEPLTLPGGNVSASDIMFRDKAPLEVVYLDFFGAYSKTFRLSNSDGISEVLWTNEAPTAPCRLNLVTGEGTGCTGSVTFKWKNGAVYGPVSFGTSNDDFHNGTQWHVTLPPNTEIPYEAVHDTKLASDYRRVDITFKGILRTGSTGCSVTYEKREKTTSSFLTDSPWTTDLFINQIEGCSITFMDDSGATGTWDDLRTEKEGYYRVFYGKNLSYRLGAITVQYPSDREANCTAIEMYNYDRVRWSEPAVPMLLNGIKILGTPKIDADRQKQIFTYDLNFEEQKNVPILQTSSGPVIFHSGYAVLVVTPEGNGLRVKVKAGSKNIQFSNGSKKVRLKVGESFFVLR